MSSSHTIGYANIQLSNTNSILNQFCLARPTTWIALVFCGANERGLQHRPDIVVGCCIKPFAFECISKESEIWQSIEDKQEFACRAVGELRRSIAVL